VSARGAVAGILAGVLGCAGAALRPAELPDAPIAIHWRDAVAARKHAEWLASQQPDTDAPRGRAGVAKVDDIAAYLGALAGTGQRAPSAQEGAGRLALLDPRSGTVEPVEAALRDAIPVAWSEPGRRLVFSQFDGDVRQLYELDLTRGEVRRLTRGPNAHSRGCLLPDGSVVASSAGRAPAADGGLAVVSRIVRRRPGSAAPEPLSEGPADHSPTCAPDGGAVVWVSRGPKGRESLVSRQPPEALPRAIGPGREPSFSRDGQWVIYAAPVGRSWRVLRVRPDGSGRAPVGASQLDEHQPALSPDGRFALVVVHDGHARRLHVRRFDGSGDRILFDDGDAEFPAW
jgi:Tol biopolymer transport system component